MDTAIAPLTETERERVDLPEDKWSDSRAAKVALADFETAERYRVANHDPRWRNADELYLAWRPQKCWPGTRVERASISVPVAFQQVESILPHILRARYGDPYPFDAQPEPGTTPEQARATRDLLNHQLRMDNSREVERRCYKSAFIRGNGIAEQGWLYEKIKKTRLKAVYKRVRPIISHPFLGEMPGPTIRVDRTIKEEEYDATIDRPFLRYVPLTDFYIDPNAPSPVVQEARYCAVRKLMAIDDLLAFEDQDGFDIPPRNVLVELARDKPTGMGDTTKAYSETVRGNSWNPSTDTTADAAGLRIEVIAYWTKERLVWLLNRLLPAYNKENPYGFLPFYNSYYTDVLDRFYGLSISDVVEPEQRLQSDTLCLRLDELSLAIHSSTIKKRGGQSKRSRRYPGAEIEVDNPREDLIREPVSNITQQAFMEAQASENRAQKATGITDLAVLGTPTSGGNSAARTATGINTLSGASGARLQYIVENSESTFIEPILNDRLKLNKKFLDPDSLIPILGEEGKALAIDPLDVMQADVKFDLRGSARMAAKAALQQMIPLVLQSFANPGLMAEMRQQGLKVSIGELWNMVCDATGYRSRAALIQPLTPEEKQAQSQPPPQEMVRMQMQKDRLAAQHENIADKGTVDLLRESVKHSIAAVEKTAQEPQGGM